MVAADLAVERADQRAGRACSRPIRRYFTSAHRPLGPARRGSAGDNGRGRRRVPRTTLRAAAGRARTTSSAAGRERREALPAQVAEPALHPVADDGVADGLDRPRSPTRAGRPGRLVGAAGARRGCRCRCAGPRATTRRRSATAGEPMRRGQHGRGTAGRAAGLRRPGSCGPCGDARTGWCARHGCACAAGIRAPCGGGGCSAGTYACSRALSDGGQGRSRRRSARSPVGVGRRWSRLGSDRGFGRHRPPTRRRAASGRPAAWTCGTRRHRVTEERYARRLRRGQIATGRRPARPAACGYAGPDAGSPSPRASRRRRPRTSACG